MNEILAKSYQSKYADTPHLTIQVDGKPLDVLLDEQYSGRNLLGLVPTLLNWLVDPKEQRVVWDRVESISPQVVPILMCPDDVDLWCTVIVIEIAKTDSVVKWLSVGLDMGDGENMPDSIGSDVDWFDGLEPLEFRLSDYEKFVTAFKMELNTCEMI